MHLSNHKTLIEGELTEDHSQTATGIESVMTAQARQNPGDGRHYD